SQLLKTSFHSQKIKYVCTSATRRLHQGPDDSALVQVVTRTNWDAELRKALEDVRRKLHGEPGTEDRVPDYKCIQNVEGNWTCTLSHPPASQQCVCEATPAPPQLQSGPCDAPVPQPGCYVCTSQLSQPRQNV
uniref:Thyroglobulin type-1 domain-containing protein n=1 Tax=Mesocestoides corti TaxID=53468 RepID=A0A5K3EI67_MESCO